MDTAAKFFLVVHTTEDGARHTRRASCEFLRAERGISLDLLPLPRSLRRDLSPGLQVHQVRYIARASRGGLEVETIIWAEGGAGVPA